MVYTYNRTLASGIDMTPYERWHGHPPDVSNLRTFGSLAYVYVASKTNAQGRAGAKRQKLDAKAVRGVFVGYAANQKGWKILDCNQGAIISSIHVTFDESCSAAARDLKHQEFRKLDSRHSMDFEYYSRTATSEVDLLFYSQRPTEEKPSANDVVLLEDFVAGFDMASVNISTTWSQLCAYASSSAPWLRTLVGPQALTSESVHPIIRAVRKQKQAELLVALENLKCKESLCTVVTQGMGLDPATYREAMARPDAARWREATDAEIASLLKNKTWTLVKLPAGKRALACKWVFKRKFNSDGTLERNKARLVVIGCQQIKFIDFDDVFAPVVRLESFRVLLAIVCIEDLECEQMDIETAFLNGVLEEEVYMQLPQGLKVPGQEGLVCRLLKSRYGLKQAPRAWHKALVQYLTTAGFEALQCEACIFVRSTGSKTQIVAIYVDNLMLIAKTRGKVAEMKAGIQKTFRAKDMGPVSYIVGIKVVRDRGTTKAVDQSAAKRRQHREPVQHATRVCY